MQYGNTRLASATTLLYQSTHDDGLARADRHLTRKLALQKRTLLGNIIGGANIHELAALEPDSAVDFISRLRDLCEAMRDFPAPTIARMAGWCMRAGCC